MSRSAPTKEKILTYVEKLPGDELGWVPYNLRTIQLDLPNLPPASVQNSLSQLISSGRLQAKRMGKKFTHIRTPRATGAVVTTAPQNGFGSQTRRMLTHLYEHANSRGEISGEIADPQALQKALGLRDLHDVNKGLHNLNKLGILHYKQTRTGNNQVHRLTNLRLRLEREKNWPVEMITDEKLPGRTDPEEVTIVVNLGDEEMEVLDEMTDSPAGEKVDVPVEFKTHDLGVAKLLDGAIVEVTEFDPESFPAIAQAVRTHHARVQALTLLRKSGDDDVADLLAEKHEDPLIGELSRLLAGMGFYG